MARQCTQPKRPRNDAWFKEKAMLAEAQEAGQIFDEEQLAFLADPGIPDSKTAQTTIPNTAAFQTEDLDAYDSDCDDVSNAKAILMANLSNYGSDVISEVPHHEPYHTDMDNQTHVKKMNDSQMDDMIKEKLTLKKQINSLEQNLSNQIKENESLLQTFTVFKNESKEKESKYIDKEIDLEKKIKELDNIVYKVGQSSQTVHMLRKPQDGGVISSQHVASPVIDDEETLILEEAPKELPKVSLVNTSLKNLNTILANLTLGVKKQITPNAITEGEWGFEHTKVVFLKEIIPFLKTLKYIFNVFDKDLLNEVTKVQTVFNQMEAAVQQYFVDKQCFEIHKKELFLENERLLQKIMSQDVMICVMNSTAVFDDVHLEMQSSESCVKCLDLDTELLKKQNAYNDLSKNYSQLEKHCISLELTMQLNQKKFQKDSLSNNQNALEIPKYFKNNDLKAQLKAKDTTICKLKDHIKSMRENDKEEKVKHEMDKINTINIELEHSEAKLLYENERLHKEIEHFKKIYKDQFDSIKKTRALSKEHNDSLIGQLNTKSMENADLRLPIATTIIPGMFKIDLEPLAPRLLNNRKAHIDYLKHTQEQANILWGIVEQAKVKQPLDNALDIACKHAKQIQELLVYVRDTCPNAYKPSEKMIAITPMNKVKKVRFFEPLTSSSNIKQVESSKTPDSNTPVLSSTGLKCSTSTCRSQPTSNKKNDRISQKPSSNRRNKVEAQPRKLIYVNCKLFTNVRLKWKPTRRLFTIVGNSYPLTRIAPKKIPHPKETTSNSVETPKPEIKVYSRRPKQIKSVGSSKKDKIIESKIANNSEPNQLWGSNATDVPSSSSLVNDSKFLGIVQFENDQVAKIMGYGDYQLGNKNTCFIWNLEGVDPLLDSRDTNLYKISLDDMLKTSLACLLSKASKTKSCVGIKRLLSAVEVIAAGYDFYCW
ncbi:hypothetical protein Tco_1281340 [Tanacetum coccineum]